MADIVIVGAGHGGAQTGIALRQQGFAGSITMIGRESDPPYDRPSLSKAYLAGEKPFERLLLRPMAYWKDKAIDLILSKSVRAVDAEGHSLVLDDESVLTYGQIVWATGGEPRSLACPGADLDGIHVIRARSDVDRLFASLRKGTGNVVIVGGGYVGLEAAAVLLKRGCRVTVLEAQPRVLARVAGEALSRFYEGEHRAHGIDLRLQTSIDRIVGNGRCVAGVTLTDGTTIACQTIIVGIGIDPAIGPLLAAGAHCDNGVVVDEYCRTTLPDIYAIGDSAAHTNGFAGGAVIRIESVQNATDMANSVAKTLCGTPTTYRATPWFWSEQFDLRLQTIGLSIGHDEAVPRGDPASRSFSVIYLRNGQVIALDCVNATADFVAGRKLVEASARISPERLRDSTRPLKELAA